jgi:polyisoprenoid-binding protein YceI
MMKCRCIALVGAGLWLGAVSLFAVPYTVDVAHTSVGFKVKHMMISTVSGNFSGFSGSYDLDKGVLKSLTATIKTETINTGIAKRDEHLRSADFFDVKKFPEMTFTMNSQQGNKLIGDLTMHGISKKVELTIEMGGEVTDPWGDKRSGFILTGLVNRKDYGLVWNKAMETGGVVVGEDVKIIIEVEGVKK